MALNLWMLYLAAVAALAVTPGPNSLLALNHGVQYGPQRTLWTILGSVLGFLSLMALSIFGIGALLQASSQALLLLKWGGGLYLIWLGWQLWHTPAVRLAHRGQVRSRSNLSLLRQGLFTALANPKVILFFGALLPQFIEPGRDLWLQLAVMALSFALMEGLVEWLLARLAHLIRPWLAHSGARFNRICGGLFALLGLALPLTG